MKKRKKEKNLKKLIGRQLHERILLYQTTDCFFKTTSSSHKDYRFDKCFLKEKTTQHNTYTHLLITYPMHFQDKREFCEVRAGTHHSTVVDEHFHTPRRHKLHLGRIPPSTIQISLSIIQTTAIFLLRQRLDLPTQRGKILQF